jgi:hypothetical protein
MNQDISTERLDELIDDVAGEIVCAADTDWNRERKQMKRDHESALLELKRRRAEDTEARRLLQEVMDCGLERRTAFLCLPANIAYFLAPKES